MASVKSQGCALQFKNTAVSPNAYAAIASVTSFQGPSGQRQVIDATTLASTGKEKNVGLPDYGQITFDFNFTKTDTVLVDIWDGFIAGNLYSFKIVLSDSPQTTFTFDAYVLSMNYTVNLDDIVRGSVTLEISGAVTDNLS